jgi:hypothetical protein
MPAFGMTHLPTSEDRASRAVTFLPDLRDFQFNCSRLEPVEHCDVREIDPDRRDVLREFAWNENLAGCLFGRKSVDVLLREQTHLAVPWS